MKKNGNPFRFLREMIGRTSKILSMMILMIMMNFNSYGEISLQGNQISINEESINLEDLIWKIEELSGYKFIYNTKHLKEYEDLKVVEEGSIENVLDEVLKDTDLIFILKDDIYVIKKNDGKESDQQRKSKKIKGTVKDHKTGESLPGVNVMVKKSMLGTTTDINGEFQMNLPQSVETLVFSFIGFETQEVNIKDLTTVNVRLQASIQELDEVVAMGYYNTNKRELTSAISSVKADELEMLGSLSVDRMLEGKATGLMITNLSTTPGAAAKVKVRGGSTFTGNQSPLWVIDGIIYEDPVPLSADDINSFDNINIIGNALTGINPSDIDRIDVLKDASATAIYGTRAANGVIVITTKRGKEGDPTLNYSGGINIVRAPRYSDFELMNSKERIDVSREMYHRNIGTIGVQKNSDRLGYEGALLNLWDGTYSFQQFQDQVSYLETLNADWFGELYQTAITQQHSVSASGGNKKSRYYFSLGYDDQQGTEKGVDLSRITARANIDLDLRDNVLLSFKVSGSVQEATYNHSSISAFDEAYYTSRTVPIYNKDGSLAFQARELEGHLNKEVYGSYHILNEMKNSERNISNKDFTISANLRWRFLKNFRFTSQASYRNTTNLTEEWIADNTFHIAGLRTYDAFEDQVAEYIRGYSMVPFGGIYSGGMVSSENYSLTNQLNYNTVIADKHVFNFNLSQEIRSNKYWGVSGFKMPGYSHHYGRGFIPLDGLSDNASNETVEEYKWLNMINWMSSNNESVYPTITDKLSNTLSFFGIVNYIYDSRYVLNFNLRSDGSNNFGQHERYKFKPTWSTSVRWNIHNENFWNTDGKIDELAFRASYGVRGTVPNTLPYLIIDDYGLKNSSIFGSEHTASLKGFPNANLRWEKTSTLNLGLNYSLLKGRISGAFDYAYSKSTDLMLMRPVSMVNGVGAYGYNGGSKDVSTYEFSIRTVNIKTPKLGWSTYLNFSHDKDGVIDGLEGDDDLRVENYLDGSIYRSGFPTSGFYSYRFDGLNDEGYPVFANTNTEDYATSAEQLEAMLVYEGRRSPLYYGGFGTEIRYGNLRLSANFSYKLGYKTRLLDLYRDRTDNTGASIAGNSMPYPYENMSSAFVNRWRKPGDETRTNIPTLSSQPRNLSEREANEPNIYPSGLANEWDIYDLSDLRVVSADHIRLNSVTLSYRVPPKVLKSVAVKNMTLGLQMSNVAVWAFDKKLKGQDPDQVKSIGMPSLSTYSFSLNVGF
jgi:TonB-linked SusC/RagA family outer membrane protein